MSNKPVDTLFSLLLSFCCTADPELMVQIVNDATDDLKELGKFTDEDAQMFGSINEVCELHIERMNDELEIEDLASKMIGGPIDA